MNRHLEDCISRALGRPPSTLDLVLHAGSRGPLGCELVFVYDGSHPLAVVKYGRTSNDAVAQEASALGAVADLTAGTPLASRVEHLITTCRLPDDKLVAVKRPGRGIPALREIGGRPRRATRVVHDAVGWLIDWQRMSARHHVVDSAGKLESGRELNPDAPATVWWRTFADHSGFVVGPAHGDFLLTNLLVERGRLSTVIDFESYRPDGIPFSDVVGLLVGTATAFLGHTQGAIDRLFLDDDWIGRLARHELSRYGTAFGIEIDELVTALPVYSDRALELARRWQLATQEQFHLELREFLISQSDRIRRAWA